MYRKYLLGNDIDSLNEEAWDKLLETIPDSIDLRDPAEFETYDEIMLNDLVH